MPVSKIRFEDPGFRLKSCSVYTFASIQCFFCAILISCTAFQTVFFFRASSFFSRRPYISGRSSRGGARRGGEERRGWVEQDAIGTIRPEDNPPSCPPANRRHLSWTSLRKHEQTKSYSNPLVESKTRTHYGPFGSRRRTAGRRGGAGLGRSGRRRPVAQAHHERTPARAEHKVGGSPRMGLIGSDSAREHEAQGDLEQADADVDSIRPENKHPSGPPANRRDLSWTSLRKQNLTESYVNRWGNEMSGWPAVNPRLTRGWPAVAKRLITGFASALRFWLLTNVPTPICLCKPFTCKACQRTSANCRVQKPDMLWAGRDGALGGAAGRIRAGLRANRIIFPGNKSSGYAPRHRRNVASTSL